MTRSRRQSSFHDVLRPRVRATDELYHTEIVHEIAMSIGTSLDRAEMLQACLSVMLRRLGGISVSVVQPGSSGPDIVTLPRAADLTRLNAQLVETLERTPIRSPLSAQWEDRFYYAWPLTGGALILCKSRALPEPMVKELGPVTGRLDTALRSCRQHAELEAARTELEHSEQRWVLALEAAGHGVWDWNVEQQTIFMSKTWKSMLGFEPDDQPWTFVEWVRCVHPDDVVASAQELGRHFRGETSVYQRQHRMVRRDGAQLWVLDQGMVFGRDAQGVPRRVIGTITDITKSKLLERATMDARDAAERASQAKTEFLANVSHELRTPMNGINGTLELALGSDQPAAQREYMEIARQSSLHLTSIVDDLLDLSKIEAGKVTAPPAPLDVQAFLTEVQRLMTAQAIAKGLEIRVRVAAETPDWVEVNRGRLRQVLINLVGNAIKFTERGHVTIEVSPSADGGVVGLQVTVSDTGIGIAADKQQTIFGAFSQADGSSTRRFEGTGLGLTISRHLVEMMGGRIELRSELGVGSRFRFSVSAPAICAPPAPIEPAPSAPPRLPSLDVLVAEDNAVNQMVTRRMLERMGHAVTVVGDGREAVAAFGANRFDVIFMDVMMPEMDGLVATRRIRDLEARRERARTPIIAVTALAMGRDRERIDEAGMDGYVGKPVTQKGLADELARVLTVRARQVV